MTSTYKARPKVAFLTVSFWAVTDKFDQFLQLITTKS